MGLRSSDEPSGFSGHEMIEAIKRGDDAIARSKALESMIGKLIAHIEGLKSLWGDRWEETSSAKLVTEARTILSPPPPPPRTGYTPVQAHVYSAALAYALNAIVQSTGGPLHPEAAMPFARSIETAWSRKTTERPTVLQLAALEVYTGKFWKATIERVIDPGGLQQSYPTEVGWYTNPAEEIVVACLDPDLASKL